MNIIVTGAGRGIGFETVRAFSAMPGHRIIAISRNIEALKALTDQQSVVIPVAFDLAQGDIPAKLLPEIIKHVDTLDIVINNAGFLVSKPFTQIAATDFDMIFNTNVRVPFMLVQALFSMLQKGSHIVNIGSMGGYPGSKKFNGLSAYSASKAAVASLSECMAEEFKPQGISVNCLALGSVQTEMLALAFPGLKAPLTAAEMGQFICNFAMTGNKFFNGKVLPVSATTP